MLTMSLELPYERARRLKLHSAFLSLHFGGAGDAQPEAALIRAGLDEHDVVTTPHPDGSRPEVVGQTRLGEISESLRDCDVFVVFAKPEYGENTGNPMCSFEECNYAADKGKTFAVINMGGGALDIKEAAIDNILTGKIYKNWDIGVPALVEWIVSLMPASSSASTAAAGAPTYAKPPAALSLLRVCVVM